MSIKHYLFALFGGLVLLLGLSQLLIGEALKRQLDDELEANSVALSRQLVDILVEDLGRELDSSQASEVAAGVPQAISEIGQADLEIDYIALPPIHVPSEAEIIVMQQREIDRVIAELDETLAQQEAQQQFGEREMVVKEAISRELAKFHRMQESLSRRYQEALHESLQTLEISRQRVDDHSNVVVVRNFGDGRVERHQLALQDDKTSATLTRFREWMMTLILLSSLLALIFVYWLSRRVSEPLSELALGHRKLGAGELGYQVTPRGIEEIRSMLDGFNAMSQKLAELSAREQQLADRKHLAELGEITRGIAHSLRNPLHTLGLLAETEAQSEDKASRAQLLARIQQKIAMMDKSIQSLLTLAASEVDRSRPVPVTGVIRDILLELSVSGVRPELSLSGLDEEHRIIGVESEVRSILHAVIINAIEAQQAQDSAAELWLGIELSQDDSGLWVQICDKGPGIDAALLGRLGQPHITTKAEGTGMGLYIASRLLASHYQGSLMFLNRPEGGTRVKVCFGSNTTPERNA